MQSHPLIFKQPLKLEILQVFESLNTHAILESLHLKLFFVMSGAWIPLNLRRFERTPNPLGGGIKLLNSFWTLDFQPSSLKEITLQSL